MGSACACFDKNEEAATTITESSSSKEDAKSVNFAQGQEVKEKEPPEVVGGKFNLVLHYAKINRSFAKFGHMDPYAIIDVDGKEVGRSKPDKSAHKEPHWESSFSWESEGVPKDIHVAVWDKNDFHRDVFIGAVTVPCSSDMGKQDKLSFTITKRSEATGTIIMSLTFEQPPGAAPVSKMARSTTLGLEFDAVVAQLDGDKKGDMNMQLGETEMHRQKSFGAGKDDEEQPVIARVTTKLSPEESKSALMPLLGSWKCVETHGLDNFLKATGVGAFQRKIANAAKWPAWDYNLQGDNVVFVNHSAIGDLTETFPLNKEYDWKDGKGNPMTCKAVWEKTPEGGVLKTERTGAIGNYKEERRVINNRLEFELTHATGVTWGRAFEKET